MLVEKLKAETLTAISKELEVEEKKKDEEL